MIPEPGAGRQDSSAPDAGEATDDTTIRVRRRAKPVSAPKGGADDADVAADAPRGGRVALRPDAPASEAPLPVREPTPIVAERTEPSRAEPQKPLDSGAVGHDIRAKARHRALALAVVALALTATAAALLVALAGGAPLSDVSAAARV